MGTGITLGILATLVVVLFFFKVAMSMIEDKKKEIKKLKSRMITVQGSDFLQIEGILGMTFLVEMTDRTLSVRNVPEALNKEKK